MRLTRTTPIATLGKGVGAGVKLSDTAPETLPCHTTCCSSSSDAQQDEQYVMSRDVADSLVSRTEKRVKDFLTRSQWVNQHSRLAEIPRFDTADLLVGKKVGEGGFSNIHEVILPSNYKNPTNNSNKRYVLKHLKPQLALSPSKLRSAAKDICNEIHVLSALDHPHIVEVQGLSSAGISGFAKTCRADSFFLVMERLDSSLLHKISQWRQRGIRKQALGLDQLGKSEATLKLFRERIRVAQQLASALVYLHQRRILHRDIKPGNIAFDANGDVKVIDFGLAVELPPSDDPNATFFLGNAGTIRYQAPEVIQKQPYNLKAETFSLSIVLWEIISLTKPYEHLSCEEVKESVTQIGCRPKTSRTWPKAVRSLLKKGWSKRTNARPSMMEMEASLKEIANEDYGKRTFPFFGF